MTNEIKDITSFDFSRAVCHFINDNHLSIEVAYKILNKTKAIVKNKLEETNEEVKGRAVFYFTPSDGGKAKVENEQREEIGVMVAPLRKNYVATVSYQQLLWNNRKTKQKIIIARLFTEFEYINNQTYTEGDFFD